MFPRPRKITRFVGFVFTAIVVFYVYIHVFGSSTESATYVTTDQGSNNLLFANRNLNSENNQQLADTMGYDNNETSNNGEEFKYYARNKIQNSSFFKEKSRCLEDTTFTTESYSSSSGTLGSKMTITSTKTTYVNPHDFVYIHNPSNACSRTRVSFLIYIHSSPSNLKKRQAIRHSWGDPRLLSLFNATLVFILGATPEKNVQKLVDMEAAEYGDIVQENFLDSYRNLTYKGMSALKWAAKYCKCASFVLKADDDILLDIVSVVDYLVTEIIPSRGGNKLVLCNLWTRMRTMRNSKSKWYLSKEEFPLDVFPPYCSGSFFILSSDIIPDMYRTALNSKFFWVDDYFITGALVNSLKIKHVAFNPVYLLNYMVVEERLKNDKKEYFIFHIKQLSIFQRMWPYLTRRHKGMTFFLHNHVVPFSKFIFNRFKNGILNTTEIREAVTPLNKSVTSIKSVLDGNKSTEKQLIGRVFTGA